MSAFLIFLFVFSTSLAVQAENWFAKKMADISLKTYETFGSQSCEDMKAEDLHQISTLQCFKTPQDNTTASINELAEEIFFDEAARRQISNYQCSLDDIQNMRQDSNLRALTIEDWKVKLPLIQDLKKQILTTRHELLQLEGKMAQTSGTLRNWKNDESAEYLERLKSQKVEKEKILKQQETSLELIFMSMWQGQHPEVQSFLLSQNPEKLSEEKFKSVLTKLEKSFAKDKKNLEQQGRPVNGQIRYHDLSRSTKMHLVEAQLQTDEWRDIDPLKNPELFKLQCRLQGKYHEGPMMVDRAVMGASLLSLGAGSLLSKTTWALRAVTGEALTSGRILNSSARMMFAASTLLSTAQITNEVASACFADRPQHVGRNRSCDAKSPEERFQFEAARLTEGNCLVSAVLEGLPAVAVLGVTAKASLKELKISDPINSLRDKGYKIFQNFDSNMRQASRIPPSKIRQLSQSAQKNLNEMGVKTSVVGTEFTRYYHNFDERIDYLRKEIKQLSANTSVDSEYRVYTLRRLREELNYYVGLKTAGGEIAPPMTVLQAAIGGKGVIATADEAEALLKEAKLFRIESLPQKKGPASASTPALLHPDTENLIKRANEMGVEVLIDGTIGMDGIAGVYFPFRRKINIGPNASYQILQHEFQHAEFDVLVGPKFRTLREKVIVGGNLDEVLKDPAFKNYSASEKKKLKSLMETENTRLAINEAMSVERELQTLGFRRYTIAGVKTEAYGLYHQIRGFEESLKNGRYLKPEQKAHYEYLIKRLGVVKSLRDGHMEGQKFVDQFLNLKTKSTAELMYNLNLIQNTMKTYENTQNQVYVNQKGDVLYKTQSGKWEKLPGE